MGEIRVRQNDFPAGLALDGRGFLYVTNNCADDGTHLFRLPGSVAIYDTKSKREVGRYTFATVNKTSNYLLAIAARRDGSKVYVASERDAAVYALDTSDAAHPKLAGSVTCGSHPVALLLNRDESRLFVANAQSDTITIIDTASDRAIGTVLLRPDAARNLTGVSPTAMALSADEKTLYVTLSDMNAVGVVDVSAMAIGGMIPAGWYPSAILAEADRLVIVNAKGHEARHPNPKYNPFGRPINRDLYILSLLLGDVQEARAPSASELADMTATVLRANHLDELAQPQENPLEGIGLKAGKITHVIYIVKENRTYDQVLGDDSRGNGDASLAIFGQSVTPNLHALSDRFVLMDNTYACGEVSGDGWVWSTQGIANSYVQRNIPYHYSNRGRTYDFEGQNNGYITGGFPATDPDGKLMSSDPAMKNGAPAVPDVAGEDVHLWDLARAANLSIRNFGFFVSQGEKKTGKVIVPDNYPTVVGLRPAGHDLEGVTDIDFRQFDLDYPDSEAPQIWYDRSKDSSYLYRLKKYGKHGATSRFAEWNHEFQEMLKRDPTGETVPTLITIRMPHDHTQGIVMGKHTPASEVADDDYGIGQIVEAVSHSPIWKSTAIFVIEDDAQSGNDHVDCHRTTAYVISPWIKRGSVDREFHNTDSVLKTMELLLGLPAMSQYDATAKPIVDWDTQPSNDEAYDAILPSREVIGATNGVASNAIEAQMQLVCAKMDFIHADAAPAELLNEIVWKSIKGWGSTMPPPRHSLIGPMQGKTDDDDDD